MSKASNSNKEHLAPMVNDYSSPESVKKEIEAAENFKKDYISTTDFKKANHYEILMVDKNASQEEITRNVHLLKTTFRDDQNPAHQEAINAINAASIVLTNETKRKEYDAPPLQVQSSVAAKRAMFEKKGAQTPPTPPIRGTSPIQKGRDSGVRGA